MLVTVNDARAVLVTNDTMALKYVICTLKRVKKMARFNANKFKREMRAAQRKINDIKRKNERAVEQYNRKARAHNQKVAENFNQQVKNHNKEIRRVNAHNERVIGDLQKRLRTTDSGPRYTPSEQALAD